MAGWGAEKHRALVIGVDHYAHLSERRQLRGCVNDALAVHALLVERLGVPRSRIDLLLSARPGRAVPPHRAATTAELRSAFARLAEDVASGDEVFVFLAGHGARVSCAATGEYVYGFAPSDAVDRSGGLASLIPGRELNRLVRTLIARGANPTMIADTCHSGGSMRIPEAGVARRLVPESGESEWRLSDAAWRSFLATHPTLAPDPAVRSGDARNGSGWLRDIDGMRDWVMLAACRDAELATESPWHDLADGGRRGVLTGSLLDELARVPDAVLPVLRWVELMPGLRQVIGERSAQRPTLEGNATRPVFGRGWQPAHRGFAVVRTADPARIELAGGELHGLEPGAEVAIGEVVARVEQATPSSCVAHLPPGSVVPSGATATLIAPGPRVVRTRACVLGADVELTRPEPLLVVVADGPADIEALPWPGRGWIVRPYGPRGGDPTADEVIAYLGEPDDRLLAARLGAAFAHWARYRAVRDRVSSDPVLFGVIDVALRIGPTAEASARREPDPAGLHRVLEDEPLWIAMQVRRAPPGRLFLGVILCSDDGNVIPLWPPSGGDPDAGRRGPDEEQLPEGQTIHVGADRYTPAFPTVRRGRRGQQASRYTFKVIACTLRDDDPPPDLSALAIAKTVQDSVDAVTAGRPKSIEPYVPEVPRRWCTWDIPVVVHRA